MTAKRKPELKRDSQRSNHWNNYGEVANPVNKSSLHLVKGRPKLNHLLRSRCQIAFLIISILAMAVVVRSGISASRGYALVATQNQTQQLEQENERLRVEIAKLKSPQRIKEIAAKELGMTVPKRMYFSHEK